MALLPSKLKWSWRIQKTSILAIHPLSMKESQGVCRENDLWHVLISFPGSQSLRTELRYVSKAGRQWAVCSAVLRSMGSTVHISIIHGIWHAQSSTSLATKRGIEPKL